MRIKQSEQPDVVTGHLQAIGCWPLPEDVLSDISADVEAAVKEARKKILTRDVTVEGVARAFRRSLLRAKQPNLPAEGGV